MSKFLKLQEEIQLLKQEQMELKRVFENEMASRSSKIKKLYEQQLQIYPNYFESKIDKNFVLYQDFPSKLEVFSYDKEFSGEHPLQDFGYFEILELVEIIKYLYCFFKQKEYKIVTFGFLSKINQLEPEIYFLIGDEDNLDYYRHFQGQFLEQPLFFDFQVNSSIGNRMVVKVQDSINACHEFQIEADDTINYYDDRGFAYYHPIDGKKYLHRFSNLKNIFSSNIDWKKYQGIKDTLSIPMHLSDSFIAEVLISIAIYKKNNRKIFLDNNDYQMIFYELFNDNSVDIMEAIDKEIPKVLKYKVKR